ncbi:hypothetical protein [Bdellovibrio sp. HCB337]|uniref:hypothetical protein n=1 Tax=Bdellovibrio sp. HCB337 TaxID=3394358 RepID=UPI0039A4704F
MKKIVFLGLILFGMNQAHAMTAEEFSKAFIEQMNHRLQAENKERKAANKTPYCERLDKTQEALIKKTLKNEDITVGEFANDVAEKLNCYPMFWAPWQRKNIGGTVVNTKAFIMDHYLVRDAIDDVAGGYSRNEDDLLLMYPEMWR